MSITINTDLVFNSQDMQLNLAANILNRAESVSGKNDDSLKDDPYKVDIKSDSSDKTQLLTDETDDSSTSIEEYFEKINDIREKMSNNIDIDARIESIIEIIERLNEISKIAQSDNYNEINNPLLSENITKKLGSKAVSLTQEEILKQYDEAVLSNTNTLSRKAMALLSR